jgi:DNA-binding Lrp family transcriptional regulator
MADGELLELHRRRSAQSVRPLHPSEWRILEHLIRDRLPAGQPDARVILNGNDIARATHLSRRTVQRAIDHLTAEQVPARPGMVEFDADHAGPQRLVTVRPLLVKHRARGHGSRHIFTASVMWDAFLPTPTPTRTPTRTRTTPGMPAWMKQALPKAREAPNGWGRSVHRDIVSECVATWQDAARNDDELALYGRWDTETVASVLEHAAEHQTDYRQVIRQVVAATQPAGRWRTKRLTPKTLFGTPAAINDAMRGRWARVLDPHELAWQREQERRDMQRRIEAEIRAEQAAQQQAQPVEQMVAESVAEQVAESVAEPVETSTRTSDDTGPEHDIGPEHHTGPERNTGPVELDMLSHEVDAGSARYRISYRNAAGRTEIAIDTGAKVHRYDIADTGANFIKRTGSRNAPAQHASSVFHTMGISADDIARITTTAAAAAEASTGHRVTWNEYRTKVGKSFNESPSSTSDLLQRIEGTWKRKTSGRPTNRPSS